jgi:hypothetical protein
VVAPLAWFAALQGLPGILPAPSGHCRGSIFLRSLRTALQATPATGERLGLQARFARTLGHRHPPVTSAGPGSQPPATVGPREFLYWAPEEFANELRVSVKSIYRWAAQDSTLPQLRLGTGKGSTLRFPRERTLKWLRQREGHLVGRPFGKQMPSPTQPPDSTSEAAGRNGSCAIPCAIEAE